MIFLMLTIMEEAFGRMILLGKIPCLPSVDPMNVKVSFGLQTMEWEILLLWEQKV